MFTRILIFFFFFLRGGHLTTKSGVKEPCCVCLFFVRLFIFMFTPLFFPFDKSFYQVINFVNNWS